MNKRVFNNRKQEIIDEMLSHIQENVSFASNPAMPYDQMAYDKTPDLREATKHPAFVKAFKEMVDLLLTEAYEALLPGFSVRHADRAPESDSKRLKYAEKGV